MATVSFKIGIDEVGYGCWAGPLVIGYVVLPSEADSTWNEITDSNALSHAKRVKLDAFIQEHAQEWGAIFVSAKQISTDGLGVSHKKTIMQIVEKLNIEYPHEIVGVDGVWAPQMAKSLIGGDKLDLAIGAASIVAKVARDSYMADIAHRYPEYGFEKHKGYGTAQHKKALIEYGICPLHRSGYTIRGIGTI